MNAHSPSRSKVSAALADELAAKIAKANHADWQEDLWSAIDLWTCGELDTKQTDILFDMIVSRWEKRS
jgi:hypothetical protein